MILELVWVLGSYGCARDEIADALESVLGLPNFKVHNAAAVSAALAWYRAGMDFGDALHLALSSGNDKFMTFDKRLIKRFAKIGAAPAIGSP